ncbi:uncharacterized protein TNCV_523341 [Trichonephila clavipes]|nr:uncharacterized protein TNCV_523341 [Trichonephila clavipes]
MQRIKWAGHVVRLDEDRTTKKVLNTQPIGLRRKSTSNLRWIDGLEKYLLVLRTKSWKTLAGRRLAWKRLLEKAKAYPGLRSSPSQPLFGVDFRKTCRSVVMITDSWPACHKFEPSATKESPCRGAGVNEDDIEELIMGHEDELMTEELQEILNEEHQETQQNVSSSEQEEDERGPMPTSAIKDLLKKWADVRLID